MVSQVCLSPPPMATLEQVTNNLPWSLKVMDRGTVYSRIHLKGGKAA